MTPQSAEGCWVIAGGGTGGHVTPALALGEELRARGVEVIFIGSEKGLENKLVPDAGFELLSLPAQQMMGRSRLAQLRAALQLIPSTLRALRILRARRAKLVLSVGGYAAVPSSLAAALLRIPLALVEPNAVPGRANRLAARLAGRIFLGFESATSKLGKASASSQLHVTGVPLRKALMKTFSGSPRRKPPHSPLRLLVFGGSQGARQINDAVLAALPHLDAQQIRIFHQTGPADEARVRAGYSAAGFDAEVVPFEPNMPSRYRWADLALCRSGALTVSELSLAHLPAIFVPYPYAADDHQRANALELVEAGAAKLLDTHGIEAGELQRMLTHFCEDPTKLQRMSLETEKIARPDAVSRILDICMEWLGEKNGQPAVGAPPHPNGASAPARENI